MDHELRMVNERTPSYHDILIIILIISIIIIIPLITSPARRDRGMNNNDKGRCGIRWGPGNGKWKMEMDMGYRCRRQLPAWHPPSDCRRTGREEEGKRRHTRSNRQRMPRAGWSRSAWLTDGRTAGRTCGLANFAEEDPRLAAVEHARGSQSIGRVSRKYSTCPSPAIHSAAEPWRKDPLRPL